MSYQLLPNIILILAIIGIIVMILRRLPEAVTLEKSTALKPEEKLQKKGLPAISGSKIRAWVVFWGKRVWNFMLEAKGIKHQAQVGYRIKKIFKKRLSATGAMFIAPSKPIDLSTVITKDEAYYLQAIKDNPKDLQNFAGLAQVYTEAKNYREAQDVYEYLVKHEPANPDFQAKLGYCYYKAGKFSGAVSAYQKSLALDYSHPNRYYNLALSQKALGNLSGARQAMEEAMRLEPANLKYAEVYKEISANTSQKK